MQIHSTRDISAHQEHGVHGESLVIQAPDILFTLRLPESGHCHAGSPAQRMPVLVAAADSPLPLCEQQRPLATAAAESALPHRAPRPRPPLLAAAPAPCACGRTMRPPVAAVRAALLACVLRLRPPAVAREH